MTTILNIRDIANKVNMKPAVVRARLRRELKHQKGARWQIQGKQLPTIIKLLKK